MTLAGNVDSFIARMRGRQADLFTSTVTVVRTDGDEGTFDPDTASYGTPDETPVYSGRALVRPTVITVADTGRTSVVVDTFEVKVPANVAVRVGDNVTVTASRHDVGLVGLGLRVTEVAFDEWQMCRRVTAVRQTARPT